MENIYEIAVHVDKTIYIKIKAKSQDEAFDIYLDKMDDQCPIISKDEDIKITEGKDYGGYLSTSYNGKVIDEE